MDTAKEKLKRKAFRDILYELAKSQEVIGNAYYRSTVFRSLENLYYNSESEQQYRHFYSDIFSVLTEIKQNPKLGNIDILGQNISVLKDGYQAKNEDENGKVIDISLSINKLYDHISLDIARIAYLEAENRKLTGTEKIDKISSHINTVKEKVESIQNETQAKISKQQKEYIAILSIFATVVLAFTGGISFSNSVLSNINQVSVYRLVFVASLIGLVLVNFLFGAFYYVNKIVANEDNLSPLYVSNIAIVLVMVAIFFVWRSDVDEHRNYNLKENVTNRSTTVVIPNTSRCNN